MRSGHAAVLVTLATASLPLLASCTAQVGARAGVVHAAPQASPSASAASPASTSPSPPPAGPASTATAPRPAPAAVLAQVHDDLARCFEDGRAAAPKMTEGKLTLNAAIDAAGIPTCVVPSNDTGLTQDVEDCMSARLARHRFEPGTPWTLSLPVVAGVARGVALGDVRDGDIGMDTIESHRMLDAHASIDALVPAIEACVSATDAAERPKGLLVAARVAIDGRTQCAVATTAGAPRAASRALPDCAAAVLRKATFPPPKGGPGIVLVPMRLKS